ncbi:MAG: DNA-3-methyladenine glycosylase [Phycisphaerae bacterium]
MWWPDTRVGDAQLRRAEQRRAEAETAVRHLLTVEPRFTPLVRLHGLERPIITPDPFVALVGSVLQQQVSMKAAAAMYERLRARCPRRRITPAAIHALTPARLRAAGLSRQKARYVRAIADQFADGRLTARRLRAMSDEQVVAATTEIVGVGRWTAEMLLIFCLDRADVWPVGDLGLRKALALFLGLPEMPREKHIENTADAWRPYRTYATWYLWRSLEGGVMPGVRLSKKESDRSSA